MLQGYILIECPEAWLSEGVWTGPMSGRARRFLGSGIRFWVSGLGFRFWDLGRGLGLDGWHPSCVRLCAWNELIEGW
jgi:hypothetical protein